MVGGAKDGRLLQGGIRVKLGAKKGKWCSNWVELGSDEKKEGRRGRRRIGWCLV